MVFDKHANLKHKFANRHFWTQGYDVSTVGLNDATAGEISKSKRSMILQSVKGYEDSSGGKSLQRQSAGVCAL